MIMSASIANFDHIKDLTMRSGAKLKHIGLPSEISNYHIAIPIVSFSIFESSENKAGAFEFIKYYTSYNTYVNENPSAGENVTNIAFIPINKAALEYAAEDSLSEKMNLFYTNLDDETIKEYHDDILEQIYSVNGAGTSIGSDIKNILTDEIPYYLSGSKSASEVCEMIQNRVSTYLAEKG